MNTSSSRVNYLRGFTFFNGECWKIFYFLFFNLSIFFSTFFLLDLLFCKLRIIMQIYSYGYLGFFPIRRN